MTCSPPPARRMGRLCLDRVYGGDGLAGDGSCHAHDVPGAGSGRPTIIATSTSRQRSIPSMAPKCAASTPPIARKSFAYR